MCLHWDQKPCVVFSDNKESDFFNQSQIHTHVLIIASCFKSFLYLTHFVRLLLSPLFCSRRSDRTRLASSYHTFQEKCYEPTESRHSPPTHTHTLNVPPLQLWLLYGGQTGSGEATARLTMSSLLIHMPMKLKLWVGYNKLQTVKEESLLPA